MTRQIEIQKQVITQSLNEIRRLSNHVLNQKGVDYQRLISLHDIKGEADKIETSLLLIGGAA